MLIEIDGLPITLHRKYIKNLNLRIHHTGDIRVSAPMALPLERVYQFLLEKRAWIDGHQRRLLQRQAREDPQMLKTGDVIFFLGQRYALHVHDTAEENTVVFDSTTLHLLTKVGTTIERKSELLSHWYRLQMQQRLPELFAKWEGILGVQAHCYGIKKMKTRWGSCHPIKKRIWLNLRLIQKPSICLEYVIVHELVHLLEASHNQRFYALMGLYMPGWKAAKVLLETEPRP